MHSLKKLIPVILAVASSGVFAATVTHDFGATTDTFGGSGIPNNAVATTTITQVTGASVTLALTATQRFSGNPQPTNNGVDTFYAVSGAYGPGDNLARWNFDFSITGETRPYTYKLLVDYLPGAGTALANYTSFDLPGEVADSENLGFGTDFAQFDPTVAGQYGFSLQALNSDGIVVGSTNILVDVAGVPEPASLALVSIALIGVAAAGRRRKQA